MGNSKKNAKQSNPYADRGLDKFSQVMAELTAKRKEIADQIGVPTSDVRLTASKASSGEWTPVYPSSAVHSSDSSSDKSASASPRRPPSPPRPPAQIGQESINLNLEKPNSSEAITGSNSRQLLASLGLGLSLLGIFGAIYALRSAFFVQILAACFVFLVSFYVVQVRSKTASSWVRRIFQSMRRFISLFSDSQSKRSVVQSSPNSKPRKPPASSPSGESLSIGSTTKTHHQETPSAPIGKFATMIEKPRVFPSKFTPRKPPQDDTATSIDAASSRLKDSQRIRPNEKKASPFKCSRARSGAKQDIRYGILMMTTVALAGLAFGTVPGILGTTISWYLISIFEALIMAKEQGPVNVMTLNKKESFKTKKGDQISSLPKPKQPQKK